MIPLLSVFSAFSFVVMMFNLPLPGGSTGHAVGVGIATVILGPWASIAAISIALFIQAVFFGDGGITTLGANCFNMAIVGSLATYAAYRLLSRRAPIGSLRRVFGGALAAYLGINLAALCAAIEFGIQPLLFHDPSGAPLYAPYPLRVTIPAMLMGHLTFAGLAEFAITAGIIGWLQRADPALLRLTAPDAPDAASPALPDRDRDLWPAVRKLWIALALLLLLTPFGILAVGTAWGEWRPQDFADAAARRQIAAASRNEPAPAHAPRGLQRLSTLWTAPLPNYSPPFLRSPSFGYMASAMVGVALIIFCSLLLRAVLPHSRPRRRSRFLEDTARSLVRAIQRALFAEETARARGFLQRLDPRVNIVGLGALIVAAVAVRRIEALLALLLAGVLLAAVSRVSLPFLAMRVWVAVLLFTGAIAAPAIFLTPGAIVWRVPALHWTATWQGIRAASFLVLRAETAVTFSALLILCTLWTRLLRALRSFRVPVVVVAMLGMTWRYIFLLLRAADDTFESRQARMIGALEPADRRRLAAGSAGVLLDKTLQLASEVHLAMQARGFRGEIRLLEEPRLGAASWLQALAFLAAACAIVWIGR